MIRDSSAEPKGKVILSRREVRERSEDRNREAGSKCAARCGLLSLKPEQRHVYHGDISCHQTFYKYFCSLKDVLKDLTHLASNLCPDKMGCVYGPSNYDIIYRWCVHGTLSMIDPMPALKDTAGFTVCESRKSLASLGVFL